MKGQRIISICIDIVCIILCEMLFHALLGRWLFSSTYVPAFIGYFIGITLMAYIQTKWDGRTVGKRIMRQRVVREGDRNISFFIYWARLVFIYIGMLVSAGIFLLITIIVSIMRKDGKAIHDLLFQTKVEAVQ